MSVSDQYNVVLCSQDVHDIKAGSDWQDELNEAVSKCHIFVPLVTEKYGKTEWTNREVCGWLLHCYFVYIKIDARLITQDGCHVRLLSAATLFVFSVDLFVTMQITSL